MRTKDIKVGVEYAHAYRPNKSYSFPRERVVVEEIGVPIERGRRVIGTGIQVRHVSSGFVDVVKPASLEQPWEHYAAEVMRRELATIEVLKRERVERVKRAEDMLTLNTALTLRDVPTRDREIFSTDAVVALREAGWDVEDDDDELVAGKVVTAIFNIEDVVAQSKYPQIPTQSLLALAGER